MEQSYLHHPCVLQHLTANYLQLPLFRLREVKIHTTLCRTEKWLFLFLLQEAPMSHHLKFNKFLDAPLRAIFLKSYILKKLCISRRFYELTFETS